MDKIFLVSQDINRTLKESEINTFLKEENGKIKNISSFGNNLCITVEIPAEGNKQKETAGNLLLKILSQLPPSIEQNGRSYKLTLVPFGSGIAYTCWDHPDGPTLLNAREMTDAELLESWYFLMEDLKDLVKSI